MELIWEGIGIYLTLEDLINRVINFLEREVQPIRTQMVYENYVVVGSDDGLVAHFIAGNWNVRDTIAIFYNTYRPAEKFGTEMDRCCANNHVSRVVVTHQKQLRGHERSKYASAYNFATESPIYRHEFHYNVGYQ